MLPVRSVRSLNPRSRLAAGAFVVLGLLLVIAVFQRRAPATEQAPSQAEVAGDSDPVGPALEPARLASPVTSALPLPEREPAPVPQVAATADPPVGSAPSDESGEGDARSTPPVMHTSLVPGGGSTEK
jgi:hypothetical protein